MKHTISRTILAISLALCAAHLGLAQNKSTGDHATATYQSRNNKPGTSDSGQRGRQRQPRHRLVRLRPESGGSGYSCIDCGSLLLQGKQISAAQRCISATEYVA